MHNMSVTLYLQSLDSCRKVTLLKTLCSVFLRLSLLSAPASSVV